MTSLATRNPISLALFRTLHRTIRKSPYVLLTPPINIHDWGGSRLNTKEETKLSLADSMRKVLTEHAESAIDKTKWDECSIVVTNNYVHDAITKAFRSQVSTVDERRLSILHAEGFSSIRMINSLILQTLTSSVSLTEDISPSNQGVRIICTSKSVGKSNTGYCFAYKIRVEALVGNTKKVQLLGRHWKIEEDESSGKVVSVDQPTTGVVGVFPVLAAGESFEYVSGCDINTGTGTMSGSFIFAAVSDEAKTSYLNGENKVNVEGFDVDEEEIMECKIKPFGLIFREEEEQEE